MDADVVSLKEYLMRVIGAEESARVASVDALRSEVHGRAEVVDRRLEDLNRLREEVVSDREQFLRTGEYNARHAELQQQITTLAKDVDMVRQALTRVTGIYIGVTAAVGVTTGILGTYLGHLIPR